MAKRTINSRGLLLILAFALAACSIPTPPPAQGAEAPNSVVPAVQVATIDPTDTASTTSLPPSPTATTPPTVTPTATSTATPETIILEGVTLADTEAFAGPADNYPWLITYSTGITLTVLGSDDSLNWLAVEIPPEQTGWVVKSDLELIDPAAELALIPTPESLPTNAPLHSKTIQLEVFREIDTTGWTYVYTYAIVRTDQPRTVFTIDVTDEKGKIFLHQKSMTDANGTMRINIPGKKEPGVYQVIVTTESGATARGSFEIPER